MYQDDFKYVLQDFSNTTLGARFSYCEVMENDRVPFKLQSIIEKYIFPYLDTPDMEIGKHVTRVKKDNPCFRIFQNLKLKIKYFEPKKDKNGNPIGGYCERKVTFEQLVLNDSDLTDCMIQELIFSNLAIMAFHI